MPGPIDDLLAIRRKERTAIVAEGRAALPARDAVQTRPVDVHHELLVAAGVRFRTLQDDLASRAREIRFGVLPAEGELPDIAEVHLAGIGGNGLNGLEEDRKQKRYHGTRKLESFKAAGNVRLCAPMNDPKAPRPSRRPLLDALGQMCAHGKETAEYLWQGPKEAAPRQKNLDLLTQVGTGSAEEGPEETARVGAGVE